MVRQDVPLPAHAGSRSAFVSWCPTRLRLIKWLTLPSFRLRIWAAGGADQPENVVEFAGGPISWNSSEYMQKGYCASYGEAARLKNPLRPPLTGENAHSIFRQGGLPTSRCFDDGGLLCRNIGYCCSSGDGDRRGVRESFANLARMGHRATGTRVGSLVRS